MGPTTNHGASLPKEGCIIGVVNVEPAELIAAPNETGVRGQPTSTTGFEAKISASAEALRF